MYLYLVVFIVLQAMFGNMMMTSLGSYEGFSQAAENVSGGREDWGYMQKIAAVFGWDMLSLGCYIYCSLVEADQLYS